jgi:hypothetical protein
MSGAPPISVSAAAMADPRLLGPYFMDDSWRYSRPAAILLSMTMPPKNLTLEDEEQAFYAALGKAITQWQAVEESLAWIFMAVVTEGIHRSSVANAAFHAIISFQPKLDMIDSAMTTVALLSPFERGPDADKSMFTLRNRAGKRADRRNDMAHFAMHMDQRAWLPLHETFA